MWQYIKSLVNNAWVIIPEYVIKFRFEKTAIAKLKKRLAISDCGRLNGRK